MSIVLLGSTSGSCTLQEQAIAGTTTLTLPTTSGTVLTSASQSIPSAALPIGSVLQVVNFQSGTNATGTGVIPYDNTIPQNTEGNEYMTLAITPKFSTSKLKIDVVFVGVNSLSNTNGFTIALFQDSTANAIAACISTIGNSQVIPFLFTHYMTAGTTSSTTFKVRAGSGAGTTTFNPAIAGGVLASSITISEIAA